MAVRARLREREDALRLRLDPAAAAHRTHLGRRPGLGAAAVAGRARLGGGDRERHLGAAHGLVESQRDLGLEVAAALGARAPNATAAGGSRAATAAGAPTAEQVGEDVAEPAGHGAGIEAAHVEAAERTGASVVVLALV